VAVVQFLNSTFRTR